MPGQEYCFMGLYMKNLMSVTTLNYVLKAKATPIEVAVGPETEFTNF
jgi:hypothetical protein